MTWEQTWDIILKSGAKLWKVDDMQVKEKALARIVEYADGGSTDDEKSLYIFCPLAGDDQFVHCAWSQGHHVVAMDVVPAAVAAMRQQFGPDDDWRSETIGSDNQEESASFVVWKHKSDRATLVQGDLFQASSLLPLSLSWHGRFDAIYDKDAFGALQPKMRRLYCDQLATYTKPGAIVYTEVKNKEDTTSGPPFHIEKTDLVEESNFGRHFDHVLSLGEVYPIQIPNMIQTGHILRRR